MESLNQTKDYVWFFLEPIMGPKAENYSFLKKLLENIKQTRDQVSPDDVETNERLYTVCEVGFYCPFALLINEQLFIGNNIP